MTQPPIPEYSKVDHESGPVEFSDNEAIMPGPSIRTNAKKSTALSVPKGPQSKPQIRKKNIAQSSDAFIHEPTVRVSGVPS
jgi:hypothetical protein